MKMLGEDHTPGLQYDCGRLTSADAEGAKGGEGTELTTAMIRVIREA